MALSVAQQPLAGRLQPLEMNNPPKVNPCLALRTEQTRLGQRWLGCKTNKEGVIGEASPCWVPVDDLPGWQSPKMETEAAKALTQ